MGIHNDFWEFSPATLEWPWVGGGNSPNQAGLYGTVGTSAASNIPGSRELAENCCAATALDSNLPGDSERVVLMNLLIVFLVWIFICRILATVWVISQTSKLARRSCLCSFFISLLLTTGAVGHAAQNADITCDRGSGAYATTFQTGITVNVNAVKAGGFSTRTCEAKLTSTSGELRVATSAEELGIDLLGSDLGFRVPVVAFQIRASNTDTQSEYRIYSLKEPPTLLRTIRGGSAYRAFDTNLHGHLEIWTDDTMAVDGFEGIPAACLDFAPTVVLRFENGRLIDVSSEFQPHFNQQIADVRAHIDSQDLDDFRSTNGNLSLSTIHSAARLQRLQRVKTQALEIVWSYLYSDRETEAWQALAAMWPATDIERIHSLLASLRTRGIISQTDGARHKTKLGSLRPEVEIYDIAKPDERGSGGLTSSSSLGPSGLSREVSVTEPKSILLRRPPQSQESQVQSDTNELLELVVDAAGKVHSARILNGTDTTLIDATKGWQFIPAFRDGEPVASRFRLRVWDLR